MTPARARRAMGGSVGDGRWRGRAELVLADGWLASSRHVTAASRVGNVLRIFFPSRLE